MALGQVGARTEGDVYQGLFFWGQAANLLRPGSLVERIVLEHDKATGVDDVAVFYKEPGVNAGGRMVTADYFQIKYHVDNRDCYSSDALIDIKAKMSLLQRFFAAYTRLAKEHTDFMLNLASNWRWKSDDKLARSLREYDGALPPKFFDDGPRGDLGKIRERWRAHLKLDSDAFVDFARTLRFQFDHFGRRNFKAYVYSTLETVGLRIPSADRAACPYESLIQQFLMNGPNSFDEASFRELCEREGLFAETNGCQPRPLTIGVRSFFRFAERLESEVDEMVCVSDNFEGRHLSMEGTWEACASRVLAFFEDTDRRARLREVESVIALECHGSLALLAGWELSHNSGVRIAPIQKPNLDVWRPTGDSETSAAWAVETIGSDNEHDDVAVCLSVTHDIRPDVVGYLSCADAPPVGRVVLVGPVDGPSPQSVIGAEHAYQLASQLPGVLASARPHRRARVHIFFACPNALMFFIGQQRDALGRLTLYEFDFDLKGDGSYQPSFSIPFSASSNDEALEVQNDPAI